MDLFLLLFLTFQDLPFGGGGGGGFGGQGGQGAFGGQGGLDIGGGLDDDDDDDDDGDIIAEGGEGGGVFDGLKNTPQFQQLRILARQNPAMLEQILTQLPRNLVELISQHQEEFLRVLQEDPILPQGGQGQQPIPQMPQGGQQQPQG